MKRRSAPSFATPSNWKLPGCRRTSTGTRPGDCGSGAPVVLLSSVIGLRKDQSSFHQAASAASERRGRQARHSSHARIR